MNQEDLRLHVALYRNTRTCITTCAFLLSLQHVVPPAIPTAIIGALCLWAYYLEVFKFGAHRKNP